MKTLGKSLGTVIEAFSGSGFYILEAFVAAVIFAFGLISLGLVHHWLKQNPIIFLVVWSVVTYFISDRIYRAHKEKKLAFREAILVTRNLLRYIELSTNLLTRVAEEEEEKDKNIEEELEELEKHRKHIVKNKAPLRDLDRLRGDFLYWDRVQTVWWTLSAVVFLYIFFLLSKAL